MVTFDILLDNNQELIAVNGDFSTDDCANNYIKYIVLAAPGHYKFYPEVGVGIYNYVNSNANPSQLERAIRLQLEADVFTRPRINTENFPIIAIDRIQLNVE